MTNDINSSVRTPLNMTLFHYAVSTLLTTGLLFILFITRVLVFGKTSLCMSKVQIPLLKTWLCLEDTTIMSDGITRLLFIVTDYTNAILLFIALPCIGMGGAWFAWKERHFLALLACSLLTLPLPLALLLAPQPETLIKLGIWAGLFAGMVTVVMMLFDYTKAK